MSNRAPHARPPAATPCCAPTAVAAIPSDAGPADGHSLLAFADGCVAVDAPALPAVTAGQADHPRAGGACGAYTGNTEVQPC